jgi:hypothetical protein
VNDIKVEYHPNSGIPTSVEHLHEYRQRRLGERQQLPDQPWKPFRTRGDFEFAEIALDAALNKAQTNALISLIHHCISVPTSFTLSNHAELCQLWEQTSNKLTVVSPLL